MATGLTLPAPIAESVVIFGDNDRNAVGLHAAWALSRNTRGANEAK
jgi:hypothetical protein